MANEPTTEASNPQSQATPCGSYPATVCSAPSLFIGGARDGERLLIPQDMRVVKLPKPPPDVPLWDMSMDVNAVLETELYHREYLRTQKAEWSFFVEHKTSIENAIDRLLGNYKPNTTGQARPESKGNDNDD